MSFYPSIMRATVHILKRDRSQVSRSAARSIERALLPVYQDIGQWTKGGGDARVAQVKNSRTVSPSMEP